MKINQLTARTTSTTMTGRSRAKHLRQLCSIRLRLRTFITACLTGLLLQVSAQTSLATNILQVYNDALKNDPTFQSDEAIWQAAKENLPLAYSSLLPNIAAVGTAQQNYLRRDSSAGEPTNIPDSQFYDYGYQLSLTQPLFNASLWAQVSSASASVKAATATYMAAQQSLILRTAAAYLSVLQTKEVLRNVLSNKRATYRQLISAQQRFKVGLVAITEVYDSQAQYDQIVAAEIGARNDLSDALEELRAITGKYYSDLDGLSDKGIPLATPKPNNIKAWIHKAEQQNYTLEAANFTAQAALANVKAVAANHLPVIDAVGSYRDNQVNQQPAGATGGIITTSNNRTRSGNIGFQMSIPLFEGGGIMAQTRQERQNYANASANYELAHRNVINLTSQAFLGLKSDISRVKADRQSIISARNRVQATEAGYEVGTRTLTDVLDEYTNLYQTYQQHADDQFTYINNYLQLKDQAGILGPEDLVRVKSWLPVSKKVAIHTSTSYEDARQPPKSTKQIDREVPDAPDPVAAAQYLHSHEDLKLDENHSNGDKPNGSKPATSNGTSSSSTTSTTKPATNQSTTSNSNHDHSSSSTKPATSNSTSSSPTTSTTKPAANRGSTSNSTHDHSSSSTKPATSNSTSSSPTTNTLPLPGESTTTHTNTENINSSTLTLPAPQATQTKVKTNAALITASNKSQSPQSTHAKTTAKTTSTTASKKSHTIQTAHAKAKTSSKSSTATASKKSHTKQTTQKS